MLDWALPVPCWLRLWLRRGRFDLLLQQLYTPAAVFAPVELQLGGGFRLRRIVRGESALVQLGSLRAASWHRCLGPRCSSRWRLGIVTAQVLLDHTRTHVVPRVLRTIQRRHAVGVAGQRQSASGEQRGHQNVVPGIARSVQRCRARVLCRVVWVGPRVQQQRGRA